MKKLAYILLAAAFSLPMLATPIANNNNISANAESVTRATNKTGYDSADDVDYVTVKKSGKTYVANWGARDEKCVFLSTYAQNFYTGNYEFSKMSQNKVGNGFTNTHKTDLYTSLQSMLKSKQNYVISYNDTRDKFCYTDCLQSNYSKISSFYSGQMISGTWDGGSTWNREHTWPNSKGDPTGSGENDIMMLRPASVSENSSRGNKAYGTGSSYYDPNSLNQKVRGDCARIILYQYVRWGGINTVDKDGKYNKNDIFGTDGVIQSLDVLLEWMEEDPVDTWEMGRNDAVQSITGARNVFVDYPEYAWILFGEDVPNDMTTPSGIAKNMPDSDDSSSGGNSGSNDSSNDDGSSGGNSGSNDSSDDDSTSSGNSGSNDSSDDDSSSVGNSGSNDDSSSGGNSGSNDSSDNSGETETKEHTNKNFNKDQRALFNEKIGFTIPYIPNDFCRVSEYSAVKDDFTASGVRFFTYYNTQSEFEQYKAYFTENNGYISAGESVNNNQVTVYHYTIDSFYVDLSYYVGTSGNSIVDVYIYTLSNGTDEGSNNSSNNTSSEVNGTDESSNNSSNNTSSEVNGTDESSNNSSNNTSSEVNGDGENALVSCSSSVSISGVGSILLAGIALCLSKKKQS